MASIQACSACLSHVNRPTGTWPVFRLAEPACHMSTGLQGHGQHSGLLSLPVICQQAYRGMASIQACSACLSYVNRPTGAWPAFRLAQPACHMSTGLQGHGQYSGLLSLPVICQQAYRGMASIQACSACLSYVNRPTGAWPAFRLAQPACQMSTGMSGG